VVAPRCATRLLTDLVGPYYTLMPETAYERLTDIDRELQRVSADRAWRGWYQRVSPRAR
jgi:hypothetical protein